MGQSAALSKGYPTTLGQECGAQSAQLQSLSALGSASVPSLFDVAHSRVYFWVFVWVLRTGAGKSRSLKGLQGLWVLQELGFQIFKIYRAWSENFVYVLWSLSFLENHDAYIGLGCKVAG